MKNENINNKYYKLGSNIAWMSIGNLSSKILLFVLIPFYTRYLSTSDYGIVDLVTVTVSLLLPLFSLLAPEAVLRFALIKSLDKRQVFSISFSIIILGCILLCVFSSFTFKYSLLKDYICEFNLYYISSVLFNFLHQFIKGIEHIKMYVFGGLINTVQIVIFTILFLSIFDLGSRGYLLAIVLANTSTIIFICVYERIWKYFIFLSQIDFCLVGKMLRYSIPLIPNSISWWVSNSADKYFVTYYWGVSINGIYAISYKIASIMVAVSSIFIGAWQISAVDSFETQEASKFFSEIYKAYSSVYIFLSTLVIVNIKFIARILFSNNFYIAWKFSIILVFASLFQAMCAFLGSIYTTALRTRMIFYTTMCGAIVNIIFNILLIPWIGAYGAAIATLISYMIVWIYRLINSRKILNIDINIFTDICSYALLLLECVIYYIPFRFDYLIQMGITLFIIFLNRGILVKLLRRLKNILLLSFKNN